MGVRKEIKAWIEADVTRNPRATIAGIEKLLSATVKTGKPKPLFQLTLNEVSPGMISAHIGYDGEKLDAGHLIGAATAIENFAHDLLKAGSLGCKHKDNPENCAGQCEGCAK